MIKFDNAEEEKTFMEIHNSFKEILDYDTNTRLDMNLDKIQNTLNNIRIQIYKLREFPYVYGRVGNIFDTISKELHNHFVELENEFMDSLEDNDELEESTDSEPKGEKYDDGI